MSTMSQFNMPYIWEKSRYRHMLQVRRLLQRKNTAYEYHGCVFHGCPDCFSNNFEDVYHPLTKQSLAELYPLTIKKKAYLTNLGMQYICIWDHEFQILKNQNVELKQFIKQLDLMDRLDPRESFFGGCTNASQLYYKAKEQKWVMYVDFMSLFKYCRYL